MIPNEDMTDEERRWWEEAASAQQSYTAGGATAGGILGSAASAIPVLTPFAPAIVPAATALGSFLGSKFGGTKAEEARKKAEESRAARLEGINKQSDRLARISEVAGPWLRVRGL